MATRWAFQGLGGALIVELSDSVDATAVAAACGLLLPGWGREPAPAAAPTDIAVAATADGHAAEARSWPGGVATAGDANNLANALGGLLVDALLARRTALCCLHAATATFAGAAILFVGRSGAGKSTLALRLAARGHRIFGDDRVLVDARRGTAMALGLVAKARLPLPPGDGLAEFAARRAAFGEGGISYLHLAPAEQAPFGERAKIAAIVLLDRDPATAARPVEFSRIGAGALAAGLIGEATAPGAAASVVAAMTGLARIVAGYRLRFAEGDRAVDALLRDLAQTGDASLI